MICNICDREQAIKYTMKDRNGDRYHVLTCGHKKEITPSRVEAPTIIFKTKDMGAGGINRV